MSSQIFPQLPGMKFPPRKTPNYNNKRQAALSGKESVISFRAWPLYSWEHEYEFLSDGFSQAPARTNYVQYSQAGSGWSTNSGGAGFVPALVINYGPAPDGTFTATRAVLNIENGSTSGDISGFVVPTAWLHANSQYTLSFWAKTNDGSTVTVWPAGAALGGLITIGSSWQRVSVTWTASQNMGSFQILLVGSDGTSKYADISVWGFQVEDGPTATAYIPTNVNATRRSDLKSIAALVSQMLGSYDTFLYSDPDFNTVQLQQFATGDGATKTFNLTATYAPSAEIPGYQLPAGVTPYNPSGSPEWVQNTNLPPQIFRTRYGIPERLSSGSRTNLILQSQAFDNASWTKTAATITAAATAAPDGTTTGEKLVESATNAQHYINQSFTTTAGQTYAWSVFVKAAERSQIQLEMYTALDWWEAVIDISTQTVVSHSCGGGNGGQYVGVAIEQAGSNGWYRVTLFGQACLSTALSPVISLANGGASTYLGDGTSGIYIWGAQLESGLQQTAYILTTTASASNGGSDYSLTNSTSAGSVNTFQQIQFVSAPSNGEAVLWTGSFYYRCRFDEDKVDFGKTMANLWACKRLGFSSVLL